MTHLNKTKQIIEIVLLSKNLEDIHIGVQQHMHAHQASHVYYYLYVLSLHNWTAFSYHLCIQKDI